MNIHILPILLFFICGCNLSNSQNSQEMKTQQIDIIQVFLDQVKEQTNIESMILSTFPRAAMYKEADSTDAKMVWDACLQKMTDLQTDIQTKEYAIKAWKDSEKDNPETHDLLEGNQADGLVYVIWINDHPTHYIKLENGSIQSILPMMKSGTITGWL